MSRALQFVYGGTAILGFCVTQYFNFQWLFGAGDHGTSDFIALAFANSASSSLSIDLFVVTLAFWVWSFFESRRLGMRMWWVIPLATLFAATATTFPVFLLMRERALARRASL